MKRLLADYIGCHEKNIEDYKLEIQHGLEIDKELSYYGESYPVLTGSIHEAVYRVTFKNGSDHSYVGLDELFDHIYSKILK